MVPREIDALEARDLIARWATRPGRPAIFKTMNLLSACAFELHLGILSPQRKSQEGKQAHEEQGEGAEHRLSLHDDDHAKAKFMARSWESLNQFVWL